MVVVHFLDHIGRHYARLHHVKEIARAALLLEL